MLIIDLAWEIAKWAWEHRKEGLTWATITSLLWVIVDKMGRKLITNQLKRLFHVQDKSEFKTYVANQKRIESKLDALLSAGGVQWNAEEHALTGNMEKSLSRPLQADIFHADSVGVSIRRMNNLLKWRMKRMKSKFTSRKFILAVVSAILIILNDGLELGIDSQTVLAFAGLVATYIVGESAVDVARKPAGGTTNAQSYSDTEHSV